MRQKSKPLSAPAKDSRRMTLKSGDSRHFSIVKTKRARRKRLKVGSLKYTCQASTKIDDPLKITVSLSSSPPLPPSSSSGKDGIILSSETREGEYGVVSVIGRRSEMEDAVRAEVGFAVKGGKRFDFFGVYDGHGGAHVACTCRERMHEVVARELEGFDENDGSGENGFEWERVMEGCFGKMDEEVRGNAAARTVGTTAVVAVVAEEEVVVANCGDCRAVMSRAGGAFALSTDHKPDRPDELKRIEDAGGRVINWNGYRVLGVLATSRCIGDQYLRPFVISKPEVTVTKRTDKDEFLILASDGLWDVLSNEVACKVVKSCLDGQVRRFSKEDVNGSRASAAATALAELAMARGSRDNISVIVVDLTKT